MLYGAAAAATALLLTAVLAGALRTLALRVARPVKAARNRTRPAPRVGGVAVAVATGAVAAAGAATGLAPLGSATATLLLAAGAVAVLGLLHDLRPMGARARVIVQAGAATLVVHGTQLGLVTGALAVLWIVFVTNAFQLLDNCDGAVGTVGVVTALGLCVCAAGAGALAVVLALLAASLTGFLMQNWHPARVVLGDSGALFTGFLLACAALVVNAGHEAPAAPVALFALTAVATTDTVLVMVSRRRAGRGLLRGGTDHIAHRLRRLGLTARGVAVVLGTATALATVTGVLLHRGVLGAAVAWWPTAAAAVAVVLLLRVPVYAARHGRGRGGREAVPVPAPASVSASSAAVTPVAGQSVDLARG
ncbi:MraY family glycosyltransferase [Streptomyces sp. NPDC057694]|uniref:MraY family glycosyltransferase n=1 Tax=Streptomyces sp. NPDC057694 TaxID=3346216 RepID=UPI00369597B1